MGVSVAALLVLAALIAVFVLTSRASLVSNTVVSLSMKGDLDRAGDRARTKISIDSTIGAGADLTVVLTNSGAVAVLDYAEMDFILDYTGTNDARINARLTYTTGTLANNQWKKTTISPDNFQPGTWNPGEQITLTAKLDPPQKTGTTGTAAVGTPNGVATTANFSS